MERNDFIPIDIVYDPTLNNKKPILCFYAPQIYLGFHTTTEKLKNGKKLSIILELGNVTIAIIIW